MLTQQRSEWAENAFKTMTDIKNGYDRTRNEQEAITKVTQLSIPKDPTNGVMYVSPEFVIESHEQAKAKAAYDLEFGQNKMVELATQRVHLLCKLDELNPSKSKHVPAIAQINKELLTIDRAIADLEFTYGISAPSIDIKVRRQNRFEKFKKSIKKGWKNVKKFFANNFQRIVQVAAIAIPCLFGINRFAKI